jgi:hypothetical protein
MMTDEAPVLFSRNPCRLDAAHRIQDSALPGAGREMESYIYGLTLDAYMTLTAGSVNPN